MAEPLAEPADVEALWRPLSDDEATVATRLLRIASRIVRTRYPDVDDRIAAATLAAEDVADVVAMMVKRAMQAPAADGVESASWTAGPFGTNTKYSNPDGNLYMTAEEKLLFGEGVPQVRVGWLA